ncbi:breast cancer type 2 susceptibility protein homolog isoform X2 [Ceratina calcarata]|uniref:Breast cancer type 2 susceptibility protein homolog isoform X2 n=1 Tax=Ceratina calcarata TaxID=156304 RepID=A0AAJ7WF42_9HYME|nr:breast cancer type 2 susceptibility protein homolog isoform X2 [Ceratina calcarata]
MNLNNQFKTARGGVIKLSQQALSRAEKLFDDINKESDNYQETHKTDDKTEASVNSMSLTDELPFGFATASGSLLKVSNESLKKAYKTYNEVSKETDEGTHKVKDRVGTPQSIVNQKTSTVIKNKNELSFGFATASGSPIKISTNSLKKAYKTYNEVSTEIDEGTHKAKDRVATPQPVVNQQSSTVPKNKKEFSFAFATASGSPIKVSDRSLKKAYKTYDEVSTEIDEGTHKAKDRVATPQPVVNQQSSIVPKSKNEFSFAFATASGSPIKISDESLKKAYKTYDEVSTETDEGIHKAKERVNTPQPLRNQKTFTVTKSENEFSFGSATALDEVSRNLGGGLALFKPLQKRKIDPDNQVTLNIRTRQNQFKKLRFSNEYPIPVIVCDNSREILKEGENQCNNTKDCNRRTNNNEVVDSWLITHEVEASTSALLDDEENSDGQWVKPKEIVENENTDVVPCSPIMGSQLKSHRRKNRGRKRVQNKENSICTDEGKSNNDMTKETNKENEYSTEKQDLTQHKNHCETSDSIEFGDSPLLMEFINQSITISARRSDLALEQDMKIKSKRINKPKPTISKLYFHKQINSKNRISWHELSEGNEPVPCSYDELIERKLPSEIFDLTADNAIEYKFACGEFYGQDFVQNNVDGIKMEDDALLIVDENGYAGITEIKRAFLASPGVDPNLVPTGWVENHYKWIVWKLASMDRMKFGSVVLPRGLTPNQVMMQLKYRYYREIDRFQRPALRRILEKDDASTKRMVLCVSSITERDDRSIKLILTDGWYSVQASIDLAMMRHIASGKVKEGTKLLMYGSVLQNCDQGFAPLEVPDSVCLKIHTNSTRRAKWNMKLGYVVPSGPFDIKLNTIDIAGGLIGKIKVTVVRVYPMLYHEKISSNESIYRNDRCEEKANNAYEKKRAAMIDSFHEKYFHAGESKIDSQADSIELAAYEWKKSRERLSKEEFYSKQEFEQVQNDCHKKEEQFRMKLESRLQESLPPPRQVTPVLKVRVVEDETIADLQIWSPSEEVLDILKEGTHVSVSNLMPAKRSTELQLTANRGSSFKQIDIPNVNFFQRTCTLLGDIDKSHFAPAYGEFDTIGVIVSIGTEPYGFKNFEAVHLACPRSDSQSSYLSILFWQGISSFGYAEVLSVGKLVACTNLEWRRVTPWSIPVSYCTERTTFTGNPRPNYLQQPFQDLKRSIMDIDSYVSTCAAEILEEVKQKRPPSRLSDGNNFNRSPLNDSVKRFTNQVSQDFAERSLLSDRPAKSPAIQKRLERLRNSDEAPGLSPIVITSSKRVSLDFKSPLRSSSDNQTKTRKSLGARFT